MQLARLGIPTGLVAVAALFVVPAQPVADAAPLPEITASPGDATASDPDAVARAAAEDVIAAAVPELHQATLTFHVWSRTAETTTQAVDTLTVKAGNRTLLTRNNLDACQIPCRRSYVEVTTVLPAVLAGTRPILSWTSQENEMVPTYWYVDDVTLTLSP